MLYFFTVLQRKFSEEMPFTRLFVYMNGPKSCWGFRLEKGYASFY